MSQNNVKILSRRGEKLSKQGKIKEAIDCFEEVLKYDGQNVHALFSLGNLAKQLDADDLAEKMFRAALELRPDLMEASNNLGILLSKQDRIEEAIDVFKGVLGRNPLSAETWVNLGQAVASGGDFEKAKTFYEEALRIKPRTVTALANLAELEAFAGNYDASHKLLDKALKIDKSNPHIHFNRGVNLLTQGNLKAGWPDMDFRLKPGMPKSIRFEHKLPTWRGQNLEGKKILISGEQGIGDQLLLLSCVPDIIAKAEHVVFEVEPRLVSLFARSFPKAEVRAYDSKKIGGKSIFRYQWDVDKLNYASPLLSLFRWLRDDIKSFPKEGVVLETDAKLTKKYAIPQDDTTLNVGLCWRGVRSSKARSDQYADLALWGDILKTKGVRFYSLMYDECSDEIADAKKNFAADIITLDNLDYKDDIEGVAALAKQLDVVVSAPSAPGAIAAMVGVETLMLYAGPSWVTLGTSYLPYAPSVTALINKKLGNWKTSLMKAGARVKALQRAKEEEID